MRVTLVSPTKPIEPPLTVKSYAAAATWRPAILPQPQTTASAGTYSAPCPISVPWMPTSVYAPSSNSSAIRSRAVNLPRS